MKLTSIMYLHETFHLVKNWGVTHRLKEGVVQKLLKTNHKMRFLGSLPQIFRNTSKTVIHVIENIALYYCSKFEKNLTKFRGVMAEKSRKSAQKWYFLLLGKHLKIHNLATSNAMLIKLTTIMYLHDTFNLTKNSGVTQRA